MGRENGAKCYKDDEEARVCASSSEIKDQLKQSSGRLGDRTTRFFDFFTSGSTGIEDHKVECLGDFAVAQDLDGWNAS